jgi:hypothetical protein
VAKKNATARIFLILGGIGVAVHAVSLRWSFAKWDPADTWPPHGHEFVLVMNATLVVLGGLFYALFLRWPVNESIRERKISLAVVLLGGLWGMFATLVALEGRYLAGACFMTYLATVAYPDGSLKTTFLLAIMEIETYGIFETFYFLVPAFLCGAIVTAAVSRLSLTQTLPNPTPPLDDSKVTGR